MPWTLVNDLLAPENKKKTYNWDVRCPFHLCPSNKPFRGAYPARLKFMQKIYCMVHQYKCKDCGNIFNVGLAAPEELGVKGFEPALWGEKPSYKHHV